MGRRNNRKLTRHKPQRSKKSDKKPFGGTVITPDENLAKIVGKKPIPPQKLPVKTWGYIKKHGLKSSP